MSIVFSDNFNSYAPLSGNVGGWQNGSTWFVPGGTTSDGNLLGCSNGVAYHDIDTGLTNKISVRMQTAIWYQNRTSGASLLWAYIISPTNNCLLTYQLETKPNGQFGFAMNDAASIVFSPSGGLFPTNGTLFALQLRIEQLSPFTCSFAVDVNNVTVWAVSLYDWSAFKPTTAPCFPLGLPLPVRFNRVLVIIDNGSIIGEEYHVIVDNIEVDNDNTKINWPVSSTVFPAYCGMPHIVEVPPPIATAGLYFINPNKATKHDSYYGGVEKKIPNPTITTARVGE